MKPTPKTWGEVKHFAVESDAIFTKEELQAIEKCFQGVLEEIDEQIAALFGLKRRSTPLEPPKNQPTVIDLEFEE